MALGNNNGLRLGGIDCSRTLSGIAIGPKPEANCGPWLNPGLTSTGVVQGGAADHNGYVDGAPERSASTSVGSDRRGGIVIAQVSVAIGAGWRAEASPRARRNRLVHLRADVRLRLRLILIPETGAVLLGFTIPFAH